MTETMEDVDGAGLAAPQVGVSQRVSTYRIRGVEGHIINPVLENSDDFQADEVEGCLSIPGLGFPVRRHRHTRVTGVGPARQPCHGGGRRHAGPCLPA